MNVTDAYKNFTYAGLEVSLPPPREKPTYPRSKRAGDVWLEDWVEVTPAYNENYTASGPVMKVLRADNSSVAQPVMVVSYDLTLDMYNFTATARPKRDFDVPSYCSQLPATPTILERKGIFAPLQSLLAKRKFKGLM